MKTTPLSTAEAKRLKALRNLEILDTEPEQQYDEVTELASLVCEAPIALISLIDKNRQWFKSCIGIGKKETNREISFCQHAIASNKPVFEITDARIDARFKNNPLTFGENPVVFYAGVTLKDENGFALGTLCVIDHEPRTLDDRQRKALIYLANQVVQLFNIRLKNNVLRESQKQLKEKNTQLKNFAGVVSHDMKMPLANMIVTIDILKAKYANIIDEAGIEYLRNLKRSAFKLSDYISNILMHYESDNITDNNQIEEFKLNDLIEDIIGMLDITEDYQLHFPEKDLTLSTNRVALEQILLNLIGNSFKYNDKDKIIIHIECIEEEGFYNFVVTDNGIGIPKEKQKSIFELFSTAAEKDRRGSKGNGIGLSTVKKIIRNLGGDIKVESKVGLKTSFKFFIEKE
ncbi:sensor histidine kinase [Psychroflexus planctonicus]|uniref:histidine kinase n=1 Tax=Psychroflexus planctonicus TaxID=1526575 RepID=A0ABQ1SGL6_9FLAO|nr:GAF domain-containing sensor histidine kinase [Psychroflexus planctonicus]GGE30222.1 sensor histidine kinase [Psychroflexus planctonicus]